MRAEFEPGTEPVLWRDSTPVSRHELAGAAAAVAAHLPAGGDVINLCESREAFLVAFLACLLRGVRQLMPAARTPAAIDALAAAHGNCARITDTDVAAWRAPPGAPPPLATPTGVVLTAFTSGSTGESRAHSKHWTALAGSVELNAAAIRGALSLPASAPLSIVGTVPSHHMYGIELTALLPLFAGMSLQTGRPLFPADVALALDECPAPRVLVSTPVHLRALVESDVAFPAVALIVSATAPLDAALAQRIEEKLGAPLLEMFGSTETCVIGTRRTARGETWHLYDGIELEPGAESTRVRAPWYAQDQVLQDVLEMRAPRHFDVRRRNSDMVEVAGRRASLADISRRLCAVPGVVDAVAFQGDAVAGEVNRVMAVVVSEGATERQITTALAADLDPVFLPRPIVLVDRIPRDAVGKIPRARLIELTRVR